MAFRYTVLTYNMNSYEIVHEIEEKDPEAEYVMVTDDKNLTSDTWSVVYDSDLDDMSPFDKVFAVRYNCFKYCHSDICVRIDGSIGVKKSLKPLIDIFEEGNYDACLMPHPCRDNFIEEYKAWIETRNYDARQAERCIEDMQQKGYDFNYKGLFQLCFSIQRRGELTDKIDQMTMAYLKELSPDGSLDRLDQIPFSYILNTHFSHIKVLPVSEQIIRSVYLQWYFHNTCSPHLYTHYNILEPDEKYVFNQKTKCLYLNVPLEEEQVLRRERELQNIIFATQKELESSRNAENYSQRLLIDINKDLNVQNERLNNVEHENQGLKGDLASLRQALEHAQLKNTTRMKHVRFLLLLSACLLLCLLIVSFL